MNYTPERNAKAFETILAIIKARARQKTLDPKTPNPKIQALSSEPSTVQPNIASEPGTHGLQHGCCKGSESSLERCCRRLRAPVFSGV